MFCKYRQGPLANLYSGGQWSSLEGTLHHSWFSTKHREKPPRYKGDANFHRQNQFRCILEHLVFWRRDVTFVKKFHRFFIGHSRKPLVASLSTIILFLIVFPSMMKASSDSNPGHSLTVFFHDLSERTFSAQKGNDLHWAGRDSYVVHFLSSSR